MKDYDEVRKELDEFLPEWNTREERRQANRFYAERLVELVDKLLELVDTLAEEVYELRNYELKDKE